MKHHFATYFDHNYLPRALALHRSLQRHCPDFQLYALCMDRPALEQLRALGLPRITAIGLDELEQHRPELLQVKSGRTLIEYYYTCGPVFLQLVFDRFPEVDLLSYLDADLFFFSSPQPLFAELEGSSIGIIEHRFSPRHRQRLKFGRFNVGWVSFRRDLQGLQCLGQWARQCLAWCFDRLEGDRYADQKYLDAWPAVFGGVHVIQHQGANLASWNIVNYRISERDGAIMVDGQPLIFFHFHGLKQVRPWLFDSKMGRSGMFLPALVRRKIFGAYLGELLRQSPPHQALQGIRAVDPHRGTLWRWSKTAANAALGILSGSYLVLWRGRVL